MFTSRTSAPSAAREATAPYTHKSFVVFSKITLYALFFHANWKRKKKKIENNFISQFPRATKQQLLSSSQWDAPLVLKEYTELRRKESEKNKGSSIGGCTYGIGERGALTSDLTIEQGASLSYVRLAPSLPTANHYSLYFDSG